MDKNLALKKINKFKKIEDICQKTREEVFGNQNLRKIDKYDTLLGMLFGGTVVLFLSSILSIALKEMEMIAEVSHMVFIVLSLELLLFSYINYITIKTNKKANQYSDELLSKFQKILYLKNVKNIWQYHKEISDLKEKELMTLSNDEGFIKICLSELKKENIEFKKQKNTILELAKPITKKKMEEQEYKEVLDKMDRVLNNKSNVFNENLGYDFKIVEDM